ncbi:hypothetical protein AAFF_G00016350 [Aldrovandia affinis]|uniref:JMY/WHAMM N-terminal domain-containing protein n=1 Tax=Aldrovandia affinis TaxID=143900 RepID=A0AAD7WHT5_9TELE|nr:hypothetical protein AAFF_G00016350 [Aldrovandia affinis]
MSFTMEDTLESGWVAVRPNVFDEKEKHKFVFIVAWNEVEGKFAITCHNRTVQRRTVAREPAAEGTAEGLAPRITNESKPKSPVKEKVETDSATKKMLSPLKAESCTNPALRGKVSGPSSPGKSVSKPEGSLGSGPARVMDIEVLDPTVVKGEPRSPEVEAADSEDLESNVREHYSWAGLFSFQDMRAAHVQLCSVNSDLEPCLPPFPEEPSGMWTVLFGPPEATEKETDALCYQLQVYLGHALDTCGWKILSQVLFTESDDPEEYYESLSELRQKGYEEVLQRAKKRLHQERRCFLVSMSPFTLLWQSFLPPL